jgi:hypothetical protein
MTPSLPATSARSSIRFVRDTLTLLLIGTALASAASVVPLLPVAWFLLELAGPMALILLLPLVYVLVAGIAAKRIPNDDGLVLAVVCSLSLLLAGAFGHLVDFWLFKIPSVVFPVIFAAGAVALALSIILMFRKDSR